jgi:putative ATP-dependent endonuclease of OLD family
LKVSKLEIENFRGIAKGTILFDDHTVIIGTNNSGKSTIIDALALVLGRDRMVRQLTEHDFYGSNPSPAERIRIVATITGFEYNDPALHSEWFRLGRAVPKWYDPRSGEVLPEESDDCLLCAQVAFSARFDRENLTVESIRYFHDDDCVVDPFNDDTVTRVPTRLLSEFGLFIVPVSRTWDRIISFGSELFRRLVATSGGIPADAIIEERDTLRNPQSPLDEAGTFAQVFTNIRSEFAKLLPRSPKLTLRLTGTDSEAVLNVIVPHYETESGAVLPSGKQGTGLLSLQIFMLLLEFGRMRANSGQNFVLAVEEPELHLSPGIQRRLVNRAQATTVQTIITSHSPHVVSSFQPTNVRYVENNDGHFHARPLLSKPLDSTAKNGIRKLFRDNRQDLVSALMNEYVLIPEGRTDFEWLKLLTYFTEIQEGWFTTQGMDGDFGCLVGIVPTHDAAVCATYEILSQVRSGLVVLVDGDRAGDQYIEELLRCSRPPELILQWPSSWTMEDVIGYIIEASTDAIDAAAKFLECRPVMEEILIKLKTKQSGIKGDYEKYEDLASLILADQKCMHQAKRLLADLTQAIRHPRNNTGGFVPDDRSTEHCIVSVWKP